MGFALFLCRGDGDEIAGKAAGIDEFIGDAVFGEVEMPVRFFKGGVNYRVFDDDRGH